MRHFRDRIAAELATILAPELRQFRRCGPFIVLASETRLECCGDFYGMTSPRMAGWFHDEIGGGNGPAMLVNDRQILADCSGCFETAAGVLSAVCVHETAHILQVPGLCDDRRAASWEPEAFKRLAESPAPVTPAEDLRERPQHGPEFIRLALHIRHRLLERGWSVPIAELLEWDRFSYVAPEWHVDALRDDFRRCQKMPLGEVLETVGPLEFHKLFDPDLSTFEGFKRFLLKGE